MTADAAVAAAVARLQRGDAEEAEAARIQLAAVVAEAPTHADAWYWWAAAQDRLGRESTAIPAYEASLQLGTQYTAEAHAFLASSLEKTWRAEAALPHIEAALGLDPGNALFLTILGNVCAALGLSERAGDAYARAVAANPSLGYAWHQLGQWQGAHGQAAGAAAHFDRAWALGYRG